MKKIEKKVQVEKTEIVYEAIDGEIFYDENECALYDKTAKARIRAKLKKITVKTNSGYSAFPGGNDDNLVETVIPKTADDIAAIGQYQVLISQKYDNNAEPSVSDDLIGKTLIIVTGYDDDWVEIRTLDQIVDALTKVQE